MDIKERIKDLSQKFVDEIIQIRHHLHQYPELSFQEFKTAEYIIQQLENIGIPYKKGFVKTGLIGVVEGKNPGKKTLALRADMDALPINEENELPFKSANSGVMHACGHDIHMATLLGAAKILNEIKDSFEGRVLLVFQPAEEMVPGGAKQMLDEGAFDEFQPELFIGQHVDPNIEMGKVGVKPGPYMASTDELFLTVKGRGGHGAIPNSVIDPVLIASHIILALQQVVSRNAKPYVPTVVSFGKVVANGATNVIPNEVFLEGTMRTFDEEWREQAKTIIKTIAQNTARAMGGDCDVNIQKGYPFLINDEILTHKFKEIINDWLGKNNMVDLTVEMTAEDFSYFSRRFPSVFYRLGTRNEEKNSTSALHTTNFTVDDEVLKLSCATMAWVACCFLMN